MSEMESVRDYNSIDLSALALKTRGPAYNGVETFDVEYEENGPLYVANAVPLKIVKGVRTDIEGREFIILSQKNLPEEMTKALNGVVERLAALCWKGYTPVFQADSGAFGLAHDFKMFDTSGKAVEDYKSRSGHYRVMLAFDCAVIRDDVLTVTPKIQQLQFVEEMKRAFDSCYWAPTVTIKVCKISPPKRKRLGKPKAGVLIAEHPMRKQRVHGKVGQQAGPGLGKRANVSETKIPAVHSDGKMYSKLF